MGSEPMNDLALAFNEQKAAETTALAIHTEQRAMVRCVGVPGGVSAVIIEYREVQQALDKAMPDCIMDIQGRKFRKKSYWRGVKTQFGLSVAVVGEWMFVQRADNSIHYFAVDQGTISIPGGEDVTDWGFKVKCRAIHSGTGIYQDGIAACARSEKLAYSFEWVGKSKRYIKDAEGRRVVDWDKTADNATVHNVLSHAQTRAENRAIADLVGFGEVSAEELNPAAVAREGQEATTAEQSAAAPSPAPAPPAPAKPATGPCELVIGSPGWGKVVWMQPQEEWWEEDHPEKGYDATRAGVRWCKTLFLEGRMDGKYKVAFVTTSNPEAHGWGVGDVVGFQVIGLDEWPQVRKSGGKVGKRKVNYIQEVRKLTEHGPAGGGETKPPAVNVPPASPAAPPSPAPAKDALDGMNAEQLHALADTAINAASTAQCEYLDICRAVFGTKPDSTVRMPRDEYGPPKLRDFIRRMHVRLATDEDDPKF